MLNNIYSREYMHYIENYILQDVPKSSVDI